MTKVTTSSLMPTLKICLFSILSFFFFFIAGSLSSADEVTLTNGQRYEGEIILKNDIFLRLKDPDTGAVKEFLIEKISVIKQGNETQTLQPIVEGPEDIPSAQTLKPVVKRIVSAQETIESSPEPSEVQNKDSLSNTVAESSGDPISPVVKVIGRESSPGVFVLEKDRPAEPSTQTDETPHERPEFIRMIGNTEEGKESVKVVEEKPVVWYLAPVGGSFVVWQAMCFGSVFILCLAYVLVMKKKNAGPKTPSSGQAPPSTLADSLPPVKKKRVFHSDIQEKDYWKHILKVFVYPFRGRVWMATAAGVVFFGVINMAMFVPFYGWIIAIMIGCYLIGCMISIIQDVISPQKTGEFDWPEFFNWADWIGPAFLYILAQIVVYIPLILYVKFTHRFDAGAVALIALGMYMTPMYILAVALISDFSALNMVNIFRAIAHTFIPYTLTVILIYAMQFLGALVQRLPFGMIPLFGIFLKWLGIVYFLFVNMRILGIFYAAHRLKLRWYDEED